VRLAALAQSPYDECGVPRLDALPSEASLAWRLDCLPGRLLACWPASAYTQPAYFCLCSLSSTLLDPPRPCSTLLDPPPFINLANPPTAPFPRWPLTSQSPSPHLRSPGLTFTSQPPQAALETTPSALNRRLRPSLY
jgi:hypothetical protein